MLNRREWLKACACAAGAFVSGCATQGTAQKRIRIGCQMYSVKKLWEKGLSGALKTIKSFGYEGVQCAAFWKQAPGQLHTLLDGNGLVLADMPITVNQLRPEELGKTIDFAKAFGVDFIYVPWFGGKTADDWKCFADNLSAGAAALKPQGIRVGYHNHLHEFTTKFDGLSPEEILVSRHSEICFELDVGHCKMAKEDPMAWLRKMSGRVPSIHAAPAGGNVVGGKEDTVDWTAVLPFCRQNGTRWAVVECEKRQDTYEDIQASIAFLKGRI